MSCEDCSRGSDIVFALDSSGSIGSNTFHEMVKFLEQIINSLNVDGNDSDPTVSRVGMLTYSDSATIHFYLNTYRKRTELLPALNVQYIGGTTNAADAIRYSSWLSCFSKSNYMTSFWLIKFSFSLSLPLFYTAVQCNVGYYLLIHLST